MTVVLSSFLDGVAKLPTVLMGMIFNNLDDKSLSAMNRVSKQWNSFIKRIEILQHRCLNAIILKAGWFHKIDDLANIINEHSLSNKRTRVFQDLMSDSLITTVSGRQKWNTNSMWKGLVSEYFRKEFKVVKNDEDQNLDFGGGTLWAF